MAPSPPPPKPKQRSQRAADALLDGPTLASKFAAKRRSVTINANAASTNAAGNNGGAVTKKKVLPHNNNPYERGSVRRTSTGSIGSIGNIGSARPGRRQNTTTVGRNPTLSRPNNARGNNNNNSLFERRHARDRVSKMEAPPTDTDRNLLALLDGRRPEKRKKPASTATTAVSSNNGRSSRRTTSSPNNRQKRPKTNVDSDSGALAGMATMAMMAPPPMPSYASSTGTSNRSNAALPKHPRKRVSSHHTAHFRKSTRKVAQEKERITRNNDHFDDINGKEDHHHRAGTKVGGARDVVAGKRGSGADADYCTESDGVVSTLRRGTNDEDDVAAILSVSSDGKDYDSTETRSNMATAAFSNGGGREGAVHNPYRRGIVPAKSPQDNDADADGGRNMHRGESSTEVVDATTAPRDTSTNAQSTTTTSCSTFNKANRAAVTPKATTSEDHDATPTRKDANAVVVTTKANFKNDATTPTAKVTKPNAHVATTRITSHATMPPEDESTTLPMALPLLGIGSKNRTAKNRPRVSSAYGGSSSKASKTSKGSSIGSRRKGGASPNDASIDEPSMIEGGESTPNELGGDANDAMQGDEGTMRTVPTESDNATSKTDTNTNPYDDDDDEEIPTNNNNDNNNSAQHAEWYDAEEDASIRKAAALHNDTRRNAQTVDNESSRSSRNNKSKTNINDNFVRQDLRNGAGSCRGARNLKKANKRKLWRAQHRFGMGDFDGNNAETAVPGGAWDGNGGGSANYGRDGSGGRNGGDADRTTSRRGSEYGKRGGGGGGGGGGGDLKCFASAKNAGVDPLDDFVDGVFSSKEEVVPSDRSDPDDDDDDDEGGNGGSKSGNKSGNNGDNNGGNNGGNNGSEKKKDRATSKRMRGGAPNRDEGVPLCTRHQRPCKLLTVKRNNKGNKGRKFYVCPMPRGEQCDFFKWEEDTIEATQRALLKSSSSSGFIARQVAASRIRFKELTVPELSAEAKKRGLKGTGKKDQILTRLLIWVRDEIAGSVEPGLPGKDQEHSADAKIDDAGDIVLEGKEENDANADLTTKDEADDVEGDAADDKDILGDPSEECEDPTIEAAAGTAGFIELSDDDESSYEDDDAVTDDDESRCDELELCHEAPNNQTTPPKSPSAVTTGPRSALHDSLSKYFGHDDFREGQEWAIRRTLSNNRTLLVAPTGQGKSLCYALPAALMEGICLVVSPLISLMQDQLRQLPPKIPAATLSGSITTSQMALIVDDILRGRYKVLFVSPERLASAAFRRLVRPKFNVVTRKYERKFPTVSLLCVDEAHCLSQWGHNFRPSYLRVRSLLPLIEPKSILALTATAGPMVVRDICNTLCIPFDGRSLGGDVCLPPREGAIRTISSGTDMGGDGVKVLNCDRDNIDVFTLVLQNTDERRYLLHKILKEKKKGDPKRPKKLPIEEGCLSKGSVIIYVWRQKDTEIVAEQLNGAGIRGGVVCYHGGMDSNGRSRAQSKFIRGKARICVATVAFGLGINKPDIEGVIHLCLPPSPEHYLQEIGRAGRDGRPARAIALPLAEEFTSRHSLAHSDRLSRDQLEIVFMSLRTLVDEALADIPPEAGIDLNADRLFIDDVHVAMPVMQTVDASDCKEESIETIFSLLEGGGKSDPSSDPSLLSVEGYLPDAATITLKRRSLEKLEKMEHIAQSISKCGTRVDGPNSEQFNSREYATTNKNSYNKYQGDFGGTAMEKGFYAYSFGTYKFSVVRCARCMGPNTEPRHVYAALRRLQGNGELELVLDTTANGRAMHLRMNQDGIHLFRARGRGIDFAQAQDDAGVNSLGAIVTKLSKQFSAKEKVGVGKVESMYEIMYKVSCRQNDGDGGDMNGEEEDDSSNKNNETMKSPRLFLFQKLVKNYFCNGSIVDQHAEESSPLLPTHQAASNKAPDVIKDFPLRNRRLLTCLSSDVNLLMQALALRWQEQMVSTAVRIKEPKYADYRDLCLAKIFHSIDAPRAPILEWYSHVLWGKVPYLFIFIHSAGCQENI